MKMMMICMMMMWKMKRYYQDIIYIGGLPKPDYLLDYFAGLFRKRIDSFNSRPKYRLELNLHRFFFHRKKNAKMQPLWICKICTDSFFTAKKNAKMQPLLNMKKNRFWKGGRIFFPFSPKKESILFFKRTGKKTGFGRGFLIHYETTWPPLSL